MIYASREHIPDNLKRTLELANIISDSRYKLYDDFLHIDGRSWLVPFYVARMICRM
ncbi:hypothetical protein DEU56DRAFT_829399 [Suillus clintonianus]|uniref:uncharacterized protein n=1 Tax=Suillus clintonianus TaxID=1904413 RepID=UPI001B871899|nr:uncharacterized protein DEU56DRAFT_829399 [Suillus clintonianus]KAG2123452.1 hypothetical protein DEU56DRAFT_829399 [Suillus clintonianus]